MNCFLKVQLVRAQRNLINMALANVYKTLRVKLDAWILRMSKDLSRKGLYEFLEREFAAIASEAEVLNIGSGGEVNRLLSALAKQRGFKVKTFDIDEARAPDILGDICFYDFGSKRFDVIVMIEVLEHLHSPHLGLKNVHAILKQRGKLLISAPFMLPLHDRPHDYFRFTKYGLQLLLKDFREVQIRERNTYFEAIDVLWVRLLQSNVNSAHLACYFLVPSVYFFKRPLTAVLNRLIRTDVSTTGYVGTAIK